ncbi:MAG: amino acid ABC transporter permease [Thermoprotei archaeon]|nr:MAG: amino acid ABC transporter permease [Thermoprotei archaeon]
MNTLQLFTQVFPYLVKGANYTLLISLSGFGIGFVIGTVLTMCRLLGSRLVSAIASAYIEFFRGTPLLVQLLFIYFGLPSIGIKLNPLSACIIALGLNSGAYQAEILRSVLQALPRDQLEASLVDGLSRYQAYMKVLVPQALRNAIPALMNEVVTLIKETSLASIIGVPELTRRAEYMVAWTFRALEIYAMTALIYLLICYTLVKLSHIVEKRYVLPGYLRKV